MANFRRDGPRTLRVGPAGWRALGQYESPKTCKDTHAGSLPGVIPAFQGGDHFCASCGHDLGVRGCIGCCKQRFASDLFEDDPCDVGGDVDHGCCYHDEQNDQEVPDGQ